MNVTVLGCGNAGSTIAGDLSLKGHNVILCKTSKAIHNDHYYAMHNRQAITLLDNGVEHLCRLKVTDDIKESIANAELIIVFIQTNYHEELIAKISPFLKDGQMVLVEPGYLSSCYLLKYCSRDITIIEAESSPIDCRITRPGIVKVLFKNVRNPIGVYPNDRKEAVCSALSSLGYNFVFLSSVVEAALHNPNLIVHTVGAIMSIPRIEYIIRNGGKYSMYREVFTPNVWRMAKQLDKEKMDVLEFIGCDRLSYVEACKFRNSLDDKRDAEEVFFDYANNSSPDGPDVPDSRYITEDVPEGLVLLESLGQAYSIPTPICTSLINIASAMIGQDFRRKGRSIEKLGIDYVTKLTYTCQ